MIAAITSLARMLSASGGNSHGVRAAAGGAGSTCGTIGFLNEAHPVSIDADRIRAITKDFTDLLHIVPLYAALHRDGGSGGMIVWNLFAWRATDPRDMKRAADPVGSANDATIRRLAKLAAVNIAGWGAHGDHLGRDKAVRAILAAEGVTLHALGFTKDGHPRHPLYLPKAAEPRVWAYGQQDGRA